jgi:cytoskeletal protein CcmA (bactofilin family)
LHIRATGKVSGKLEYSQIQIERGGEFRGEMQQVGAAPVYPSGSAPSTAKPGAATPTTPSGAAATTPSSNKDAST